ncbi:MAG: hypothetical protein J5747_03455 [Spirochaetaceae bacterium]|nr:hypothetical protein [Spirochaetaceae bacterium]
MDKHLNLFRFFNGSSYEFWEDNLSRAFAICLKNDATFLSFVLRNILDPDVFSKTLNGEYTNSLINIDLQQKVNYLGDFTYIYAVACSGLEINEQEIKKVKSRDTDNPETDLLVTIGDICIVFEFKRTNEDCSAQLKQQAEIIKNNSPKDSNPIKFVDLDWKKIIQTALSVLSIERQINSENVFLKNFIDFIEEYNTDWFPVKKIAAIPFPVEKDNYEDPNSSYLYNRLDYIKEYVFGENSTKWIGDRYIIAIDKPWAQELHVGYCIENNNNYLTVEIYPGDTKGQGWHYFKDGKEYNWENEKICGYAISVSYYLKFSHFNSGITWLELTKDESKSTHNFSFFSEWSGRYNKNWSRNWKSQFVKELNKIIPNWKDRTDWDDVIANSNRNYFDLSVGTHLKVLIPYNEAQKLDDIDGKKNSLAEKIKQIYKELAKKIDA